MAFRNLSVFPFDSLRGLSYSDTCEDKPRGKTDGYSHEKHADELPEGYNVIPLIRKGLSVKVRAASDGRGGLSFSDCLIRLCLFRIFFFRGK